MLVREISKEELDRRKKHIEKCVEYLMTGGQWGSDSFSYVNTWRCSHIDPLRIIQKNLPPQYTNTFRLKRMDTILSKVARLWGKIPVTKFQDIGGIRCIVDTEDQVYEVYESLKNNEEINLFFKEVKVNDYIKNPKKSGYRSFHVVYKYVFEDLSVELQIRTKEQHYWSTSIELIDIVKKKEYKFKETLKKFPKLELSKIPTLKENLYIKEDHILFLIVLDLRRKEVTVTSTDFFQAKYSYFSSESRYPRKISLLVGADSLESLRIGYPAYLLDASNLYQEE